MEGPATDLDGLLRAAVEQKRLVELVYRNKPRTLEPYDYGIHKGSVKLLGYQVAGFSSGPLPNWRWMELSSISHIMCWTGPFPAVGRVPQANTISGITLSRLHPAESTNRLMQIPGGA